MFHPRHLASLGVIVIVAASASAQTCPGDDLFENNDTILTAAQLPGPGNYPNLALLQGDPDFFAATVPANSDGVFTVTYNAQVGTLFVTLQTASGDFLDFGLTGTGTEQVAVSNTTASPLDVVVSLEDIFLATPCNDYTLDFAVQPVAGPCATLVQDPLEPNDDCPSASLISAGLTLGLTVEQVDPDFLRINVPPQSNTVVTVNYGTPGADLDIAVLAPGCGGIVSNASGSGGQAQLSFVNASASATDYTLRVTADPLSSEPCNNYAVTTTFTSSNCSAADPFENNDTCASATSIGPGAFANLTVASTDEDWYSVTVPDGETVEFGVLVPSTGISTIVEAFTGCSSSFTTLSLNTPGAITNPLILTNTSGASETYLFRHYVPVPNACSEYGLSVSISGTVPFESYCDASDNSLPGCSVCPCGNTPPVSLTGPVGCINSNGTGAQILASGEAAVSNDTLRFQATGANPSTFGVLISGVNQLPMMSPCPPGTGAQSTVLDGLRCAGGSLVRHGSRAIDATGSIGFTNNSWGTPSGPAGGLIQASGFTAGQTRNFQLFYREGDEAVCATGQNTSNGVRIVIGL